MTNYEKYNDLVISCFAQDSICDLAQEAYGIDDCADRTCTECYNFITEWLDRKVDEMDEDNKKYAKQ